MEAQTFYEGPRFDSCTDVRQDLNVWRSLEAKELAKLVFSNTEPSETTIETLLDSCEPEQIEELLKLLGPEERAMLETARLKLFLCNKGERSDETESRREKPLELNLAASSYRLIAQSFRAFSADGQ